MAFGPGPFGTIGFGGDVASEAAVSPWATFIASLYPDSHNVTGPVYTVLIGAIGAALDQLDPAQTHLAREFTVTTSTDTALDRNGIDWGVPRRAGEDDASYRARILSALAVYAEGSSDAGISAAVAAFTGTAPTLIDCSSDGWVMGESSCGDSAMADLAGIFTLFIYVKNPDDVAYSHFDMEAAVRRGLLARARAYLIHNGVDTSVLGEASNATVLITG